MNNQSTVTTMLGYTVIKNEAGEYSFAGTRREELVLKMEELRNTNARIHRQICALQMALNQDSTN